MEASDCFRFNDTRSFFYICLSKVFIFILNNTLLVLYCLHVIVGSTLMCFLSLFEREKKSSFSPQMELFFIYLLLCTFFLKGTRCFSGFPSARLLTLSVTFHTLGTCFAWQPASSQVDGGKSCHGNKPPGWDAVPTAARAFGDSYPVAQISGLELGYLLSW